MVGRVGGCQSRTVFFSSLSLFTIAGWYREVLDVTVLPVRVLLQLLLQCCCCRWSSFELESVIRRLLDISSCSRAGNGKVWRSSVHQANQKRR